MTLPNILPMFKCIGIPILWLMSLVTISAHFSSITSPNYNGEFVNQSEGAENLAVISNVTPNQQPSSLVPSSVFDFVINRRYDETNSMSRIDLDLKFHPKYTYDMSISSHQSTGIEFVIEFQLMYSDINAYNSKIFCRNKQLLLHQPSEDYTNHCIKELFTFSNEIGQSDATNTYCGVKRDKYQPKALQDISNNILQIHNLLPSQTYEINVTMIFKGVDYGKVQHFDCEPPGAPVFPPQADRASFTVDPARRVDGLGPNQELVDLYWRTVPKLLEGHDSIKYDVLCNEYEPGSIIPVTNLTLKSLSKYTGKVQVEKSINATSICRIKAWNDFGFATNFSRIVLPPRHDLINLGRHFRFSAVAPTNQKYMLEWNPFKVNSTTLSIEVLPRNSEDNIPLQGYFTIYWCLMQHLAGCHDISGMMRLNTSATSYLLELPKFSKVDRRLFGFSYTHTEMPPRTTGIIWAKCDTHYEQDFALKALKISVASDDSAHHQAIAIEWVFPTCETGISRIATYEINYCLVGSIVGCAVIWNSQPTMYAETTNSNKNDCETLQTPNRFIDEHLIGDLVPATRYNIRMRYTLTNGTTNAWSNTISAYTAPDPAIVLHCQRQLTIRGLLAFMIALGLGTVLYMKYRIWWPHSKSLLSRYKETRATVSTTMSAIAKENSEVSLNYCANRAKSELTMGMLDDEDETYPQRTTEYNETVQRQHNFIDQTVAYIPRKLVEGNQDEGTAETSSDNAQGATRLEISSDDQDVDDISINSHSSFLNTLLDEQSDLNNNIESDQWNMESQLNETFMTAEDLKQAD